MRCCKGSTVKGYLEITGIFSTRTAIICRLLNILLTEDSGALTVHRSSRWNPGNDF